MSNPTVTHSTDAAPAAHGPAPAHSQFRLLVQRRFGPFFATQLAGAFNDSFLKQLVILLVTFHATDYTTLSAGLVANMAAGLFILPFVLFSAYAGQLADRFDKAKVIRAVKMAEVAIMVVASAGFFMKSLPVLLASIFAMGCHSAFFGPVKYSLLPRVLAKEELTGGNGLLEMGTFLSILLGTLVAGVLAAMTTNPLWLSLALLGFAVLGLASSLFIPATGEAAPDLKLHFSVVSETIATVKMGQREGEGVWNSLLAISWFWFIGAVVLSQIPALGKDLLQGDTTVVTVLLATFSVGIAVGSLLCERLSGHKVEIGLVPIGSIGLSVFTADLALSADRFAVLLASSATAAPLDWTHFLAMSGSLRVLGDIALLGVFGGLFIVPLYAFVQLRTAPQRQSRIISANNILNALFMVVAAGMSAGLLAAGLSVTGLILVCAALNAVVALYIYKTVPEFLWRFLSWFVVHAIYRLRSTGTAHIPEDGPAILAPNHVSYVDALVLSALCPRPIRFVMDASIFRVPVLSWLFRQVNAIPIASAKREPETLEKAMAAVDAALRNGELVCVFPEGALTRDGQVAEFKPGIRRMLDATPVPVIPIGLSGLWETAFARNGKSLGARLTSLRPGRRLEVNVGAPQSAEVDIEVLRSKVLDLVQPRGPQPASRPTQARS
ncbi:MFS transporter [Roseateles amylovorans]|uniref:MFS transporter n=1 Tax=Roseateles amylovorans TaxID=2978473 RepID=A0ABY6B0F3_9BURK|nr:MFS transporter [Roseateles amylovorans]UXH78535.1 MFS transporter [Roseateles amylovorans]